MRFSRRCAIQIDVYLYITYADDSRQSKPFIGVCVCLSVCPHDKTKTAETIQSPNLPQG